MTPAEFVVALVVLVAVAVIAHAIGSEPFSVVIHEDSHGVLISGKALTPEESEAVKDAWRSHHAAPAALAVTVLDALDGFDDSHGFLPVPDDVQTARARHIAAQLLRAPEGETR